MSANRFLCNGNLLNSTADVTDKVILRESKDDVEIKDDEIDFFLHDVPYSSSSSSFSIPWANEDDAIRQNQLDWEQVEKMLSGEASLPEEPELHNEILEWQRKFPQLLTKYNRKSLTPVKRMSINSSKENSDSLELDCISNLSLNSCDVSDMKHDQVKTFINENRRFSNSKILDNDDANTILYKTKQKSVFSNNEVLALNSVPLTLHKRHIKKVVEQSPIHNQLKLSNFHNGYTQSAQINHSTSMLNDTPHYTTIIPNSVNSNKYGFRMPPIYNLKQTDQRVYSLSQNQSFVQLTQIQQAKSANTRNGIHNGNYSKRHVRLTTTNNYFNNRNTVILPSINMKLSKQVGANVTETSDETSHCSNATTRSNGINREHQRFVPKNILRYGKINSNNPSIGRSISAAMLHPRSDVASFLPNSASKFKIFN